MLLIKKTGTGDAPVFVCDHCKKRIEDIDLALYTWKELDTLNEELEYVISPNNPSVLAEEGQIYTLHKACIDQFELKHGGDAFDWPWMELIDLLVFLIHNGGSSIEAIQERAKERRELYFS